MCPEAVMMGSEESEQRGTQTGSLPLLVGLLAMLTSTQGGENPRGAPAAPPNPRHDGGIQQGAGLGGEGGPSACSQQLSARRQGLPLGGALYSTKHSRAPPLPHGFCHSQKARINPSFVFLIISNLCHKTRGPGAVYLHPPRYLFLNNVMFSLKQVLSPWRVPVCACVFCLSSGLHFLMDGWGFRALFFKVVHKMYLLFFISCLSQGVICFHSEK